MVWNLLAEPKRTMSILRHGFVRTNPRKAAFISVVQKFTVFGKITPTDICNRFFCFTAKTNVLPFNLTPSPFLTDFGSYCRMYFYNVTTKAKDST